MMRQISFTEKNGDGFIKKRITFRYGYLFQRGYGDKNTHVYQRIKISTANDSFKSYYAILVLKY